ncbi:MAG: DUF3048 domain-containing protein [Oscillospiraceae bacterium]|jgi:hypothetical protein|nr:DUF3048 domain-containing protein [Oscillospiraceae bacterium]
MKKFRSFLTAVISVILVLSLFACTVPNGDTTPTPDVEPPETSDTADVPTATPVTDATETPEIVYYSALTGEEVSPEVFQKRPAAVMVNNIQGSLPQSGITEADVIFEADVEGCTRLLAVYQDISAVKKIGSVRSARHYYIELADSLDAIYLHAGWSPKAMAVLNKRTDYINGLKGSAADGAFFRDPDRYNKGWKTEYTLMLDGGKLWTYLTTKTKIRSTAAEGYKAPWTFVSDGAPAGGFDATTITTKSKYKTGKMDYDAATRTYLASQYNKPWVDDAAGGKQLAFTNLIVIKTKVGMLSGEYGGSGRLDINTTQGGSGFFFCGGKGIEIKWSRKDLTSPFVFTTTDGKDLPLGVGKTYIGIIPENGTVQYS